MASAASTGGLGGASTGRNAATLARNPSGPKGVASGGNIAMPEFISQFADRINDAGIAWTDQQDFALERFGS